MKQIDIDVSRTIPASPEEVFDAWIDARSPGGPWSSCERLILNPVVDGLFYHAVKHQGRSWAHYGRFVALEKGRRIEHTWMSEATQGLQTTVTVTLEARGKDTLVNVRHTGIPDDELGRSHREGWGSVLSAAADQLGSRR